MKLPHCKAGLLLRVNNKNINLLPSEKLLVGMTCKLAKDFNPEVHDIVRVDFGTEGRAILADKGVNPNRTLHDLEGILPGKTGRWLSARCLEIADYKFLNKDDD